MRANETQSARDNLNPFDALTGKLETDKVEGDHAAMLEACQTQLSRQRFQVWRAHMLIPNEVQVPHMLYSIRVTHVSQGGCQREHKESILLS